MTTVLCLHGNRQNRDVFSRYCKPIQKKADKAGVKLVLINAQYPLSSPGVAGTVEMENEVIQRQWWSQFLDVHDIGNVDWTETMKNDCECVLDYIDKCITVTGATRLLGFSQGANVVLTYMQVRKDPRIRKVVACNGYGFDSLKREAVECDLLHVVSDMDDIVPPMWIETGFQSVEVMKHTKGHRMVTRSGDVKKVVDFLT